MLAKEARELANKFNAAPGAAQQKRINDAVEAVCKEIRKQAKCGSTSMGLSILGNFKTQSEIDTVKTCLEAKGFVILKESDMGFRYEVISW